MMSREYSKEEKIAYVEEFKSSGMSQTRVARERGIPDTTFRGWIGLNKSSTFGEIDLTQQNVSNISHELERQKIETIVFANDDIRIELKEGFDKQFFRKIVEVLINDN